MYFRDWFARWVLFEFHSVCALTSFLHYLPLHRKTTLPFSFKSSCVASPIPIRVTAETHRVFIRVHREGQLLEGLSDLPDRRLPGHSQQLVVVLALRQHCLGQGEREGQSKGQLPPTGPLDPGEDHGARHQAFRMVTRLGYASRKYIEIEQVTFNIYIPQNDQDELEPSQAKKAGLGLLVIATSVPEISSNFYLKLKAWSFAAIPIQYSFKQQ